MAGTSGGSKILKGVSTLLKRVISLAQNQLNILYFVTSRQYWIGIAKQISSIIVI